MSKRHESLDLGVVLERRKVDNPWIDHSWRPVAVIAGAAKLDPRSEWIKLREGEDWAHFHAGTLPLELFRRETQGYKVNLTQDPPKIFIVLRDDDDPDSHHNVVPFLVTACPYEAQDYLDSGEEIVEAVAMPDPVVAFLQFYCDEHHVEEPFHKRKRKPHKDETSAFDPGAPLAGRRGRRRFDA